MAVYNTTRPLADGRLLVGRVERLVTTLTAWNNARMTRNMLAKLTDRELSDIGLERGAIDDIRA
ncbi:MAG: DUF1127 domain-containing protein [Confluentimicrobium sp.]|jgi:uncharacterized protein YjiS (DUF1127 family)|uniref:Uncharacterized protein YjiS (DUF1127 family) n=1 Tax=Actibacterium naphthalenivorans TaxID=1614693 RepID=A0A840C6A2_9RHOB|nr:MULTISPECIES: DUF1127 domain-containing protein [Actibacterium]KGB80583.1 hypothetical protein JT55_18140 [Rhodovulum sp. NI22]MDY6858535.1 DUF1127 domain-containing protein [Pseudomonadota bacterium]ALG89704.1 hypothetical protein TQ29_05245 [Actibacterium sp. EMB200-NS6]MBB4020610.1 uncharacterized protein YjiS (DUF1127 family) [Actibacterium naphthalenivorans]MBC56172.1 DUF1127 domain-containing protein [Actibacterium sp.]|tara:strand:+ start:729 stop:920 length:192 start_codon:yes stop_codon:yes gene_type:complete